MKRHRLSLVAAVLLLAPAGGLLAGTLIKAKETDLIEGGVGESVISVDGTDVKVETAKGGQSTILIYQKNSDRISLLNPGDKTFRQISITEMKQMISMASDAMQQVERQMAGLPPEQQAMMRAMLKKQNIPGASGQGGDAAKSAPLSFTKKSSGETAGTWTSCTLYEGKEDGTLKQEVWTTSSDAVAVNPDDWKAVESLGETFSKLTSTLGQSASMGGFSPPNIKDSKQLGLEGVPVKVLSYGEGRASRQWELVEAKQETFSKDTFAIPADYTKIETKLPSMSRQQGN